uniref:Uncharacterized protein n=1 Tax=Steinernema glaseri TaxID=37863 RepID=A0A1I8AG00_9BILA
MHNCSTVSDITMNLYSIESFHPVLSAPGQISSPQQLGQNRLYQLRLYCRRTMYLTMYFLSIEAHCALRSCLSTRNRSAVVFSAVFDRVSNGFQTLPVDGSDARAERPCVNPRSPEPRPCLPRSR